MKRSLLFAVFIFSSIFLSAQTQLSNSDFELWENVGSNTEEPNNWNGIKTGSGGLAGLAPKSLQRSTDIRPGSTGTYSARVYSNSTFGVIANGNLTIGRVNAGSTTPTNSSNYNYSSTGNTTYSEPLNALPDSLVFWVKYTNGNAASNARVRAVIHDAYDYRDPSGSDANSPSHVVGDATLNFASTSGNWVRMSVPFNYTGPATSPDFMLITFTSNSVPGGGNASDQIWVDDVVLIYNPRTTTAGTINPLNYNISATVGAPISIPFTKTGNFSPGNIFTAQLSDASGSFASPVNIGTLASVNAGVINGTIPAGTPAGTGYRVRVAATTTTSSNADNGANITINIVNNSIAPVTAQTIAVNANGTSLSVTENTTAVSREWKYSTTPGSGYISFPTAQTGTSYVPNFSTAGTYYIVCESNFGGSLSARSNEVTINVVGNSIAPSTSQSLLVGVNGNLLTVNETPAGTSREWKFSNTSGSGYGSFAPVQTGTTYLPNFAAANTYYVICQSVINGVNVISNEVVISVGTATLTTGTVTGSPFEFSASAPGAVISVPYVVSTPLGAGNIFTAELSDASGSFAAPTVIGTVSATTSGSVSATIPSGTAQGSGYRIRVISSNPPMFGADNGTDLVIDQFSNAIAPAASQTILYNTAGSAITVTESQNATSREWRYSMVSGSGYTAFSPTETGISYAPLFTAPGVYYVISASTNQYGDEVISNEVMITVTNGNTLATGNVSGAPFYISPSANVTATVNFTSDIFFNPGNSFTAELSDINGNFSSPVTIGTLAGTTPGPINAVIPNSSLGGTGYRVRVVSSDPATTGTDNGTDLQVILFTSSFAPADTQFILTNQPGNPMTAISTHPSVNYAWALKPNAFSPYVPMVPAQTGATYIPQFANPGAYDVTCLAINMWDDTTYSNNAIIVVNPGTTGIGGNEAEIVQVYWSGNNLVADLRSSGREDAYLDLVSMSGQVITRVPIQAKGFTSLPIEAAAGIYTFTVTSSNWKSITGKIAKN